MDISEEQLESYIFDAYEQGKENLERRGLRLSGIMSRQSKIGNYGRCDLLMQDAKSNYVFVNIIELKKDVINEKTLIQAVRYARGIQRMFALQKPDIEIRVKITLIGKRVEQDSDFLYIGNVLDQVRIYTYDFGWDGIFFKELYGYKLTDEGFEE